MEILWFSFSTSLPSFKMVGREIAGCSWPTCGRSPIGHSERFHEFQVLGYEEVDKSSFVQKLVRASSHCDTIPEIIIGGFSCSRTEKYRLGFYCS